MTVSGKSKKEEKKEDTYITLLLFFLFHCVGIYFKKDTNFLHGKAKTCWLAAKLVLFSSLSLCVCVCVCCVF